MHIVPPQAQPIRLQDYGVALFDATKTKSALKKVIKKKYITVDGMIADTGTYLKGGEKIRLVIPPEQQLPRTFEHPLTLLFEDDYLAGIQKPAGIRVSGNYLRTVAHALPGNLSPSTLTDVTVPQPVHRLDYGTTGVLLVGKTSSSIRSLNRLFENRKIAKTYFAITIGTMAREGEITSELDGKEACTSYNRLQSISSKRFGTLNLVRLQPATGRKHQLRRHLAELGNPILGDPTYGNEELRLKGKGLYLHAHSLEFTHPFTGKELHLIAMFPKKFERIFPEIKV